MTEMYDDKNDDNKMYEQQNCMMTKMHDDKNV